MCLLVLVLVLMLVVWLIVAIVWDRMVGRSCSCSYYECAFALDQILCTENRAIVEKEMKKKIELACARECVRALTTTSLCHEI